MFGFLKRGPKAADQQNATEQKGTDMTDAPANERIQQEIDNNEVLLFMKGTPMFPQCGFSAATVQALTMAGVKFGSVNVLEDPEVRDGIKEFSSWPTIPQLYVKGEFIGGCDIVREMFESGELQEYFKENGVPTEGAAAE